MSYDIWIGPDFLFTCEQCGTKHDISDWQERAEEYNATYNLAPLFYEYIVKEEGGDKHNDRKRGMRCLDGMTGRDAVPILKKAIKNIKKDRGRTHEEQQDFDNKYGDTNGGVSIQEALQMLTCMELDCRRRPYFFINIS